MRTRKIDWHITQFAFSLHPRCILGFYWRNIENRRQPISTIFIVDDDPNIRELVKVFLRDDGFEVAEASDGVEALARLETLRADMVILDVMMPNMDGCRSCAARSAPTTIFRC